MASMAYVGTVIDKGECPILVTDVKMNRCSLPLFKVKPVPAFSPDDNEACARTRIYSLCWATAFDGPPPPLESWDEHRERYIREGRIAPVSEDRERQ
jgi:hypothetical protein